MSKSTKADDENDDPKTAKSETRPDAKGAAKTAAPDQDREPEQYGGRNLKDFDPKAAEAAKRTAEADEDGAKGSPPKGGAVITITKDGKFSPSSIRVNRGGSVRFVNKDTVPHSIIFTGTPTQQTGMTQTDIGASLIDVSMLGVGGQSSLPPVGGGGSMGGTSAGGGAGWTDVGDDPDKSPARTGGQTGTGPGSGGHTGRLTSPHQGVPAGGGPCTPVGVSQKHYNALQNGGAEIMGNGTFSKVFDAAGTWTFRTEHDDDNTGTVQVS